MEGCTSCGNSKTSSNGNVTMDDFSKFLPASSTQTTDASGVVNLATKQINTGK